MAKILVVHTDLRIISECRPEGRGGGERIQKVQNQPTIGETEFRPFSELIVEA